MSAPAIDIGRLTKLLAMFSSSYDGEVVAAARAAHRLLREHKLSWSGVLQPALPPPPANDDPITINNPFAACDWCLDFRETILSAWETEFCRSVAAQVVRGGTLSDKQNKVLARVVAKCRRSEAGAAA